MLHNIKTSTKRKEEKHYQNKQNKGVIYGPGQFGTVSFMTVYEVRLLYRQCFLFTQHEITDEQFFELKKISENILH